MADSGSSALQVTRLNKSYLGKDSTEISVLRNLDLTLDQGESLAIVGASGAGKSTLLHCLGTLDQPTSGDIRLLGEKPPFHNDEKLSFFRNQKIGFVFQFHHLLAEFTALENVALPGLIAGTHRKIALQMAGEILERVGLSHRLDHRPGQLSGGEQQRVAIARSLFSKPALLLADEPTGNLDRENGENVFEMLLDLQQQNNTTLVLVTHNWDLAKRLQRILILEDGHLKSPEGI